MAREGLCEAEQGEGGVRLEPQQALRVTIGDLLPVGPAHRHGLEERASPFVLPEGVVYREDDPAGPPLQHDESATSVAHPPRSRRLRVRPLVVLLKALLGEDTPGHGALARRGRGRAPDLVVPRTVFPGPVVAVPALRLRTFGVLVPVKLVSALGRGEADDPFLALISRRGPIVWWFHLQAPSSKAYNEAYHARVRSEPNRSADTSPRRYPA